MAAGTILVASNLDLAKNELRNPKLHLLAAAPGTPTEGQLYYNSTTKRLEWRSDAAWIDPTDRARHSGTQLAATVSDFDGQVRLSRLDQLAVPIVSVSLNSQKITNLLTPTLDTDASTKLYVDNVARGMDWKDSVRAATTANIVLSGAQTIDGVAVVAGNRVLVKSQTAGADNGIYVAAAGAWARAVDADTSAEVSAGMAMHVAEGTANGDQQWILTTNDPIILGTTALSFTQLAGGGGGFTTAGTGLTGTGATVDAIGGNGIAVTPDAITVDTAVVVRKYAANVPAQASPAMNHALNTRDVTVAVIQQATPWAKIMVDWEATDVNNVTLRFAVAPLSTDYRCVIHG